MQEQLIVESKKPVQFEPFCVRCGRETKQRFYFDRALGMSLIAGLFWGWMISLVLRLDKGNPWVPFCFRCRWQYASPSREGLFHVVFAILFIVLGFYLLATERYIMGWAAVICIFIALFRASRLSRNRRAEAMPFYIKISKDKIVYTFTSGHFYNEQMQILEQDEMIDS